MKDTFQIDSYLGNLEQSIRQQLAVGQLLQYPRECLQDHLICNCLLPIINRLAMSEDSIKQSHLREAVATYNRVTSGADLPEISVEEIEALVDRFRPPLT